MILVCAHAGLKTGEDGPTHADPQALQLLQENFPPRHGDHAHAVGARRRCGRLVTASLAQRPAVIAPFVTRPNEPVPDREALGLAAADGRRDRRLPAARARGRRRTSPSCSRRAA